MGELHDLLGSAASHCVDPQVLFPLFEYAHCLQVQKAGGRNLSLTWVPDLVGSLPLFERVQLVLLYVESWAAADQWVPAIAQMSQHQLDVETAKEHLAQVLMELLDRHEASRIPKLGGNTARRGLLAGCGQTVESFLRKRRIQAPSPQINQIAQKFGLHV